MAKKTTSKAAKTPPPRAQQKKLRGRPPKRHISMPIGPRMRDQRLLKGLSLEQVSEKTRALDYEDARGISAGYLSRIERQEAMPSLQEAHWICTALDMQLTTLLEEDRKPWYIVRAQTAEERLTEVIEKRRKIERLGAEHDLFIRKGFYRYAPLTGDRDFAEKGEGEFRPRLQAYLFSVTPFNAEEIHQHGALDHHEAEEFLFCLDGTLEFWYKQHEQDTPQRIVLTRGDCVHYNSTLWHGYRGVGTDAKALSVIYVERTPRLINVPELVDSKEHN